MKRILILLLGLAAAVVAAEKQCVKPQPWYEYSKVPFQSICSGYLNDTHIPHFHNPVDCYTREVVQELAYSIANQVFQCKKWCVYSLKSDMAWIWIPNGKCWKENKHCNEIPDELAVAVESKEKICPDESASKGEAKDCVPLKHKRELTIKGLKTKCPKYHSQAKPNLHHPIVCETGEMDGELSQAVINGAFQDCQNWCIYSLKNPAKVAWFWDSKRDCWTTNNDCTKYAKEVQYAVDLRSKLCTPPCTEPRSASLLSASLISLKCPNYNPVTSVPQFHHATICNTTEENAELKHALANFAFSECKNWCVYSLEAPLETAWEWTPKEKCWRPSAGCLAIKSETDFALNLREVLCLDVTEKDLAFRRRQRPTVLPEDTGLWGDAATQQDAIEMYSYFAGAVCLAFVSLVLLQCLVPPVKKQPKLTKKQL